MATFGGRVISPYFQDEKAGITIYHGDCREILPFLDPVDAIITDPPYGVNIADWDAEVPYSILPILLNLSKGPVVWFGSSPHLVKDLASFVPPPDRVMIWAPKFRLGKMAKSGIAYRYHPIHTWRISERNDGPVWDVLDHSTEGHHWWNHPGTKPKALMLSLVGLCPKGGIVLDPFLGSGTTLVAAKESGRRGIGIELEEENCSIAVRRLTGWAGKKTSLSLF